MKRLIFTIAFFITVSMAFVAKASVCFDAVAPSGGAICDSFGAKSDWVEIYNDSDGALDVGGMYISDDATDPYKWRLPSVVLAPKSGFAVFCSGKNLSLASQELHTNFKISPGETLLLTDKSGEMLLDCVTVPNDIKYGQFYVKNYGAWAASGSASPSVRAVIGGKELYLGGNIVIAQAEADYEKNIADSDGDMCDYAIIRNENTTAISLDGWYLSDDKDDGLKWQFPDGTVISQGGSLLVYLSGKNRAGSQIHTNFKLSGGETLYLLKPDQTLVSSLAIDSGKIAAPVFSRAGGFYDAAFDLTLSSDNEIYYTLDGSVPARSNPAAVRYTRQIRISKPMNADVFSRKPSNPSFDLVQGFGAYRRESRGYLPPYADGNKCMTVRAIAYSKDNRESEVVTNTYFIEPSRAARYSLPVISISSDPAGLFSDERGILVPGTSSTPNYDHKSSSWERELHIEMFDTDGTLLFGENAAATNHGGGGRHSTQKTLTLSFKRKVGASNVKNTFLDTNAKKYGKLLLRNGGQGPNHMGYDDWAGILMENSGVDAQSTRHAVVFIDGEYFGIYALKETADEDYLESVYSLPKEMFAVLESNGEVVSGHGSDANYFKEIVDFASSHDMNDFGNYSYVADRVDLENLATYYIVQTYLGNTDWPHHNIRYWRARTDSPIGGAGRLDGKWRWLLFDADCIMGSTYDSSCAQTHFNYDGLSNAINNGALSSKLLKAMLASDRFKNYFISRAEELMNTTLSEAALSAAADILDAALTPEMMEHVTRWRYPSLATTLAARADEVPSISRWMQTVSDFKRYGSERQSIYRNALCRQFSLPSKTVTVNILWDENACDVSLSQKLNGGSYQMTLIEGTRVTLSTSAKEGYKFKGWNIGGITEDHAAVTVTVRGDMNITAQYEKIQ